MTKCRPFGVNVPLSKWCGVRPCCVRGSPLRIAQRARDVLFERRWHAVRRTVDAARLAPGIVGELLRGDGITQRVPGDRRGEGRAAPQEHAPVEQPVSGHDLLRIQFPHRGFALRHDHDPQARRAGHPRGLYERQVNDRKPLYAGVGERPGRPEGRPRRRVRRTRTEPGRLEGRPLRTREASARAALQRSTACACLG